MEIERKLGVEEEPVLDQAEHVRIEQGISRYLERRYTFRPIERNLP
jgi:hypothetical protein